MSAPQSPITYEQMMALFLETRELMKETDRKFQATDRKFQEIDRKFQEIDRKTNEVAVLRDCDYERTLGEIDKLTSSTSRIIEQMRQGFQQAGHKGFVPSGLALVVNGTTSIDELTRILKM